MIIMKKNEYNKANHHCLLYDVGVCLQTLKTLTS